MQDLYQRQLELEEEYSNASIAAGQKQVLDAFKQGRATDVGSGRILLAKSFELAVEAFKEFLKVPVRGVGGKYRKLLKIADPEILVMAALREVINSCAVPEPVPMQDVLRKVGKVIESESMLVYLTQLNNAYTERTVQYLDSSGTKAVSHRYRTFLAGAKALGLDWEQWTAEERVHTARLLCTVIYESTGLFKWTSFTGNVGEGSYYIKPSDELAKHFQEVQGAARALIKYPPMLLPPMPWNSQYDGGYMTEWFRHNAPMCGIRFIKREHKEWVIEGLGATEAQPVRNAMNKAQNVPYRVNKSVLEVLRQAVAMRVGILGLPSYQAEPKPVFPLPEGWLKAEATEDELEQFKFWKSLMAEWYTREAKRVGRQHGILSKINELARYQDEDRLYFPTFIDWRGRLYFRSNLNPQSSDAVKGCVEFAEGKPLGERGLFWLKVHVANCCGYDKHDAEIKAKWTDDNWPLIQNFINNPLDVDAPEPDTAFTLLQSGLALQEALSMSNPESYICHVPVAMDATCSGLQHLSALTRDTVGAYYTNLIDNGADQKSDIYMQVAKVAEGYKLELADAPAIKDYWKDQAITRGMAKKPVMTFVYGSTLLSTIDSIALDMYESGLDDIKVDGKVAYSLNKLAKPVGQALRQGVDETVPESAKMMKYMQMIVRKHKADSMRWVSPVGVPVVNWAEGSVIKHVHIKSMGVNSVYMKYNNNKYDTRIAANGIVPNFVHSMDSAHLCMTVSDFEGQVLPIHDSFATHPSTVDDLHKSLRSTFITMYNEFKIEQFLEFNNVDLEEYEPPVQGNFDLDVIKDARFMFC